MNKISALDVKTGDHLSLHTDDLVNPEIIPGYYVFTVLRTNRLPDNRIVLGVVLWDRLFETRPFHPEYAFDGKAS